MRYAEALIIHDHLQTYIDRMQEVIELAGSRPKTAQLNLKKLKDDRTKEHHSCTTQKYRNLLSEMQKQFVCPAIEDALINSGLKRFRWNRFPDGELINILHNAEDSIEHWMQDVEPISDRSRGSFL